MKRSFAELGGGGGGKSGGLTKYFKKAASNNATTPNTSELTLAEPTEEEKASLEHTSMHASWYELLRGEFQKDYFLKLKGFLKEQQELGKIIYPPRDAIYSWSKLPFDQVKVVILGQDPYHGPGQAHGLAFSVMEPTPPPPSLVNIYKALEQQIPDFKKPKHGWLGGWADQGVLLLNAVLTVRKAEPNSHQGQGWENLTDAVIQHLDKKRPNLVFMLWGAYAQKKGLKINKDKHLVLKSVHPSPLSASKGFFDNGHFSQANEWLKKHGEEPIDWSKLPNS